MWVKHVTNTVQPGNTAYLEDYPNDQFILHFPIGDDNVRKPSVGELIFLYQNLEGAKYFTHIVTPVVENQKLDIEDNPTHPFGRQVKTIAMVNEYHDIPVNRSIWKQVNFSGISQGRVCRINHISSIQDQERAYVTELIQSFTPYFILRNRD